MSKTKKKLSPFVAVITKTVKLYNDNEMSIYAGYTTLYIMMAMVPLLTLLIGVVNLLPDVSLMHLEAVLYELLPNITELRSMIHNIIANVNRRAGTLAISLSAIATLWSASNGVNALQLGLQKIGGTDGGSLVRKRLRALLYTVLFIALIPALLVFRVLRGSILNLIINITGKLNVPDVGAWLIDIMEYSGLITTVGMAVVILLAYTFLRGEQRHRQLRYQLPGTVSTTLMWLASSNLFELFIERFWHASSLYGSLAAVFLTAMWLKIITMILFFGAALNEALCLRREEMQKAGGNRK